MKNIKIGNRDIKIKATPLTPYVYKKAFNQSFSGDLYKLASSFSGDNMGQFDDINFLQIIWAMEKTADRTIDDFETWLSELECLDITEIADVVLEEAMNATFHTKEGKVEEEKETSSEEL